MAATNVNDVPAEYCWFQLFDPNTGVPYYFNVITNETSWKKPKVGDVEQKKPAFGLAKHLSLYVRHDKVPTPEELARPARKQANPENAKKLGYIEGETPSGRHYLWPPRRTEDYADDMPMETWPPLTALYSR
eukprot:GHVU01099437.1.p2 GENE.GHVU01099437.1~~GHVU01099437.1.p2  ORF type:complete len:132 (-),score=14.78 GHVU01099437.1:401-796(-)